MNIEEIREYCLSPGWSGFANLIKAPTQFIGGFTGGDYKSTSVGEIEILENVIIVTQCQAMQFP